MEFCFSFLTTHSDLTITKPGLYHLKFVLTTVRPLPARPDELPVLGEAHAKAIRAYPQREFPGTAGERISAFCEVSYAPQPRLISQRVWLTTRYPYPSSLSTIATRLTALKIYIPSNVPNKSLTSQSQSPYACICTITRREAIKRYQYTNHQPNLTRTVNCLDVVGDKGR